MQPASQDRPSLRYALKEAEKVLVEGLHPERARRDAETLLLFVLRKTAPATSLAWLIAHDEEPLVPDTAAAFCDLVERRLAGEPIQYITGEAEFLGLLFHVNRDVLIPRPETEHLVEKAIALAQRLRLTWAPYPRIADIGTGSGAIAVALAGALPFAEITATDISPAALAVAKSNAARNGVAERVHFVEGDLLGAAGRGSFDMVVSNPPYIAEGDRATLDVEVREYEPARALFAGADGLEIYRRLIPAAFRALVSGGYVLLEIGYGQEDAIEVLLEQQGFTVTECIADYQGIPRVVVARRG